MENHRTCSVLDIKIQDFSKFIILDESKLFFIIVVKYILHRISSKFWLKDLSTGSCYIIAVVLIHSKGLNDDGRVENDDEHTVENSKWSKSSQLPFFLSWFIFEKGNFDR